ncbi:hypothetical protein UK99_08780 [Frankia casuarinae]|uniref:FAD-dependent oxidoreductase n=1 Tax=Frankia casuarinae (strain DSM 45818 / CECT 9043 / HFP020203 / CcI3) TaxID=106370 RepID=UPI000A251F8A|nr:FAD-dependent oxidoreductase [Frankia casuarinae]ORT96566.1 hypothetical protein UK99_08780 [Frankia casuarinae]
MVPPGYGPAPTPQELADEYDICVVGSGAAGSVVAWLLARAGLSVAVVEQGGFVTDEDSYDDVLAAGESAWVRQENGTWAKVGSPWTTCNVGGGTLFFGGGPVPPPPARLRPGDRSGPGRPAAALAA